VSHCREPAYDRDDDITKATSMEIVNTMKDLLQMNPLYGEQFRTLMSLTGEGGREGVTRRGVCGCVWGGKNPGGISQQQGQ
jgi:Lon-like ATP-dependent protease